jgi:hypothetical protein
MSQKIVAALPLPAIIKIIAKLIRYAKGGIDKDEAADLIEDLLLIVAHLADGAK